MISLDSKYHLEVYCFWLERHSNDLALLWPSAMKASISSTVRGTQVSSSIPVAVTAMSSSIRTCYREHAVTKVFQLGMRSRSGTSESPREVSGCGRNSRQSNTGIVHHHQHPWHGVSNPPWASTPAILLDHTSSTVTPSRAATPEMMALQVTQVVPLLCWVHQEQAE